MNCQDVRDLLPLSVYGDLAGAERAGVEAHLAHCDACRKDLAALGGVRQMLDESPTPRAPFDASAIHHAESQRHRRAAWRWRVAALVGLAAAIAFAAVRLEVRFDNQQVAIRLGRVETVPSPDGNLSPIVARQDAGSSPDVHEQLKLLNELVHALAANLEAGDRGNREEMEKLRQEIAAIQKLDQKRWSETRRDVSALYTAQFGARNTGANP